MRSTKPATQADRDRITAALAELRSARDLLRRAGASQAAKAAARAVKSAEGAQRHARHRMSRTSA